VIPAQPETVVTVSTESKSSTIRGEMLRASRSDGSRQCLAFGAADPACEVAATHALALAHGSKRARAFCHIEGKPLLLQKNGD
jgi:hypothetical protein